jgi:DNA invertase Pin-like site-specific DNA recombinase
MGKMFFNILATFAEFAAGLLRMRTREGLAFTRAKGNSGAWHQASAAATAYTRGPRSRPQRPGSPGAAAGLYNPRFPA